MNVAVAALSSNSLNAECKALVGWKKNNLSTKAM